MNFPTNYTAILDQLSAIKPLAYCKTRNYLDGDVTYLSPYISRGVVSLRQVAIQALQKHPAWQIEKFLQELAWREYWQRVWEAKGALILQDLRYEQQGVQHRQLPAAIRDADTGIRLIDEQIGQLYNTGYMHNHVRMYVSSITCNIAAAHWLEPARWMYYHLLDGDIASNMLSWQWVAGANASKKYYCNQENINRYTGSNQRNTFLDKSYEELPLMPVPDALRATCVWDASTHLPVTGVPVIDPLLPTYVYNSYNLDPLWAKEVAANRVLLLEPAHFEQFPVSNKVIEFIKELSANIAGIQIFTGSFEQLKELCGNSSIHFKKHPAFLHYKGEAAPAPRLFPSVSGYYPSFSAYWKQCQKYISTLQTQHD